MNLIDVLKERGYELNNNYHDDVLYQFGPTTMMDNSVRMMLWLSNKRIITTDSELVLKQLK
jgi:hypothetical protein